MELSESCEGRGKVMLAQRLNGEGSAGIWQDKGSSVICCNWGIALCIDSNG